MTNASEHRFCVDDGRDRLGAIVQRDGGFDAFDPSGVHLGTFPTVQAASAAVSNPRSVPCVRDQCERGGGDGN